MVLRDKKIETPYDLAGLKYGASSTHIKGFAEVLGMTFVFTRFPDIYTGIERGVFDAFSLPPGTYTALGIEDIVKYMVDHYYLRSNIAHIMSLEKWNSLPPHLQDLMLDTIADLESELAEFLIDQDNLSRQIMLDAGVEFIKFSPADAEWYVSNSYRAERKRLTGAYPNPEVLQLADLLSK